MLGTLALYKQDLVAAAARLGDINDFEKFPKNENLLANGYIEFEAKRNEVLDKLKQMEENPDDYSQAEYEKLSYEAKDLERKMESYLAALLLRHWKDINNLYQKCRTCDSKNRLEDFSTIIYDRIMYAFKYRRWVDNPKLNAQQCINMAISTEVKNQMYFSNLQKNMVNSTAHVTSLDKTIGTSSDDRETTLADTLADENSNRVFSPIDDVIQTYINQDKIVEAVVIETIAYNDTMKVTTETKTRIVQEEDPKTKKLVDKEVKYKVNYTELWRYKIAQYLMNLPEDYVETFKNRFKVTAEKLVMAVDAIRKAKNTKIYKFIDNTLLDAKNNEEIKAILLG